LPNDLTRRISELVNKKPYAPEDDLQEALDDLARDIALIEPNPVDWGGWVTYMLEQMEGEAQRLGRQTDFDDMLSQLRKYLHK
jgi:hypothetical protein